MFDSTIPRPSAGRFVTSLPAALLALLAVASLPQPGRANTDAPCYDPSGTIAPGYYPCDSTAFITNCCASGWTCFSNSLCVVTTESNAFPNLTARAVARAMCTNPKWNNDICGDFCVTGAGNADGDMVACGDNHFCCLGDYNAGRCNCSLSTSGSSNSAAGDSFVVNNGKAQTIIGESASFTGTVSYRTSQPTRSPTSASTSASKTTSGTSTASNSGTSASGSGAAASGSGSPTPSPSNNKHVLALGLGIGLGVGIPLLAVLAFAAYWFRHQRNTGGIGGRRSLPTDLALDGTAFGEQMAMQGNEYRRGGGGGGVAGGGAGGGNSGIGGHHLDLNDLGEVPPPPPQVHRDVS